MLLAACGGPAIPSEDLEVRVAAAVDTVELGKAFALQVERVWSKKLVPQRWDEDALAPLTLRLRETKRDENASHVREIRRYDAYAFVLSDVAISGLTLRAVPKTGGAEHSVVAEGLALTVRPALDPARPGAPELPGPLPRPFPWLPVTLAGAAAFLAALLVVRRLRRPAAVAIAPAPTPPQPTTTPEERALRRIARLRGQAPADVGAVQAFYTETAAMLRDFVGERLGETTATWTSDDLLAATGAPLQDPLRHCDRVRFGRHGPGDAERARMLDGAEAFVRAGP